MLEIDGSRINESNYGQIASEILQSGIPWQQEIASFLLNWYSPEPSININTSGSTGTPKQISLLKSTMLASAKLTCDYFALGKNSTALLCLPSKFIAGKMMIVRALVGKFKLICVEPSTNPLPNAIKEFDFAAMVPMQVENSLKQRPAEFLRIKDLIIGGAAPSRELCEKLASIPCRYTITYGMTETATHVAVSEIGSENLFTYNALGKNSFEIDSRTCLIINAPELGIASLPTNDVVELISPTSFKLKGRFDNAINTGGVKVHPEEIERKIDHLIDSRFFITGFKDGVLGEVVTLVLEGAPRTSEDWHLDELLSKFETLRKVEYVYEFEETPTGKIDRTGTLRLLG